jgi:hypothetical protein
LVPEEEIKNFREASKEHKNDHSNVPADTHARGQSIPQPKITGVLTTLTPKPGVTPKQVMSLMPAEIRATLPLYLDGKIQQWFMRGDGKGVIFFLNCKDEAEARAFIQGLPLSKANLVDEQFIPVGPLLPLGMLLRDNPENK